MRQKERKQSAGHVRFYCLLALLLVLIALRYALQIDVPPAIFLVIIVCMALFGDLNELVCICICCIALHESIDLFYALTFCILIFAVKFRKEIRISAVVIPILAMVIWELLHCFRPDFSLITYISSCIPLLMLALFMCIDVGKFDYAYIARAFAVTLAAICLMLLLKLLYLSDFNILKTFAGLQRLGNDAAEVSLDGKGTIQTNTLGILCVLATTCLMQLRMSGRGSWQDMVLAILLMVFGALTASRTYLVCLALMFLLLLFGQQGSIKKKMKFLGVMILVAAAALLLVYLIFPDLLEYYISRFQDSDITTGRDVLMVRYGEFILENPRVLFFGIGLNCYNHDLMVVHKVAAGVPHNGIQELIIAWGLPGLILFLGLFIVMVRRAKDFCPKQKLLNYVPLIILFVKSQAGQMLNSPYTMLAFSLAYLSMCQDFAPKQKN